VRGHEFHRTVSDPPAGPAPAWQWSATGAEGFAQGNVHASYLHLNWAGSPALAQRFVAACAASPAAVPSPERRHAHR
jgi:cobyrinic acid a,c-diamide synthase